MRPEAAQVLADFIRENGKSVIRMTSSCKLSLTTKLADFPEERALLVQALDRGVPDQILQHAGTAEYDVRLLDLAHDLAGAAGVEFDAAAAAVIAWAEALNRPIGYQKPAVPEKVYPVGAGPGPAGQKSVRMIMAAIAAAGGFLGSAGGAGLAAAVFVTTDAAVDPLGASIEAGTQGMAALAILLKMAITGTAGGVAAAAGWLSGKGDDKPWAGFAAAFGAGFTVALIFLSFSSSLIRVGIVAASVYGATFTAAARGGHKM